MNLQLANQYFTIQCTSFNCNWSLAANKETLHIANKQITNQWETTLNMTLNIFFQLFFSVWMNEEFWLLSKQYVGNVRTEKKHIFEKPQTLTEQ